MQSINALERNALCSCNSGKKYKKCCAHKDMFHITYGDLSQKDAQGNFPALPKEDQDLLDSFYLEAQKNLKMGGSEECAYFYFLKSLKMKYPDNPFILTYIVEFYEKIGFEDKMYLTITEAYEKFPLYLFARVSEFLACLNKDLVDRAFAILGPYQHLKQLYPNREIFHITEVTTFEHAKVQYFCKIGDLGEATRHLLILERIASKTDALLLDSQNAVKRLRG